MHRPAERTGQELWPGRTVRMRDRGSGRWGGRWGHCDYFASLFSTACIIIHARGILSPFWNNKLTKLCENINFLKELNITKNKFIMKWLRQKEQQSTSKKNIQIWFLTSFWFQLTIHILENILPSKFYRPRKVRNFKGSYIPVS